MGPAPAGVAGAWPEACLLRLPGLLEARCVAALAAACRAARQLSASAAALRAGPERVAAEQAQARLELVLSQAGEPPSWQSSWEALETLEQGLHSEMRYAYGLDWEMKPGKLVSKKGTWLKTNTCFSWELQAAEKLYLPQGVVMPVLQIGRVTDANELKRHDWVAQHLRVWMKPAIVSTLEARRAVWFVYMPHWEERGLTIVAAADTWLKRTTQMSGELQPFELVYVPKGLPLRLSEAPGPVEEEWERCRHAHVQQHRRVVLAEPPVTVKQDQYEILVGQGDQRPAIPGYT